MSLSEDFDARLKLVEQAIDEHGSYLLSYLKSLTKQKEDAEELFDDLWIWVLNKLPEDRIFHVGVLRRKAYQLFVDRWRKQKRNPVFAVEDLPDVSSPDTQSEALTDEEEEQFKIRFFSEYDVNLSEKQKHVLWLSARMGYTHREISDLIGIPASTVGDWLLQCREAFADYLNETNQTSLT